MIASVKNGKGGLGLLISDSGFQGQVQKSINNIEQSSKNVTEAAEDFKNIAKKMEKDLATVQSAIDMGAVSEMEEQMLLEIEAETAQ